MFCAMLSLMTTLSITMMFMNHPLSMGLILIMQTITVAIITGMMVKTFMFSYIITIIMLSGALVLFIYMASIASNEKFKPSIKIMIMSMIIYVTIWSLSTNNVNSYQPWQEISTLSKMFNTTTAYMTMLMIIFLLFTMIVVSSIANIKEGPLRMKI
uniref:NADH dehydrogenase subunit 6 n=1 Tax=Megacopta horvathi TaxID=2968966 RepID=UPI00223758B1|nr:NADH dehydrogenase subunit 6 [Megacopta horvathi]UYA97782.1 NADH dehydrogenase subunit 6 [Megacopta horvathi]UYA97795.1 NADH dehydrogenase subunit 6 [Megacopta horvathi]